MISRVPIGRKNIVVVHVDDLRLSVAELEDLVSMFNDDIEPKTSHQEKYEACEYLIAYVKSGVEVCEDMFGNGILKDILNVIRSFEDPRIKKSNVDNCTAFLNRVFEMEDFFQSVSSTFLNPGERYIKRFLSPLSISDACFFLEKFVQQVSSSEVNKYQIVGIIGIFASAVHKGLLDNIMVAMNQVVKCPAITQSTLFPPVSASEYVEKIESLITIFLNLFMDVKVKKKYRRYNLHSLVLREFQRGFFKRLPQEEGPKGNSTV